MSATKEELSAPPGVATPDHKATDSLTARKTANLEEAPLIPSAPTAPAPGPHHSSTRTCGALRSVLTSSVLTVFLVALVLVAVGYVSLVERPQEELRDVGGKNVIRWDRPNTTSITPTTMVPPPAPPPKLLPLEFVHATKTGGSAIEKAAAKNGIAWGACHYLSASHREMNCPSPPNFQGKVRSTRYQGSPLWHIPPIYWSPNLLEGHKTFTVVRNPYTRAVSEYYNKWDGYRGPLRNDKDNMNQWIQLNLIDRPRGIRYLPHHKYVYDDNGRKVVDYVIKFENLTAEFNELMMLEDLPIRLDATPYNERTGTALLDVEHLTNETIRKINAYCMDDFTYFDYEPMHL